MDPGRPVGSTAALMDVADAHITVSGAPPGGCGLPTSGGAQVASPTIVVRGLMASITFPKAFGEGWSCVATINACSEVNPTFVIGSGAATKHSWMAISAPLAYSTSHSLAEVSEPETNFRRFHSRLKPTGPSSPPPLRAGPALRPIPS